MVRSKTFLYKNLMSHIVRLKNGKVENLTLRKKNVVYYLVRNMAKFKPAHDFRLTLDCASFAGKKKSH